jgi:hypothetical protein
MGGWVGRGEGLCPLHRRQVLRGSSNNEQLMLLCAVAELCAGGVGREGVRLYYRAWDAARRPPAALRGPGARAADLRPCHDWHHA